MRTTKQGGSITAAHAFDPKYPLKRIFERRYSSSTGALELLKTDPVCLFWKESQRTLNTIEKLTAAQFASLMAAEPRLRFLVPMRNPLDVTASTLKSFSVHVKLFGLNTKTASQFQARARARACVQSAHARACARAHASAHACACARACARAHARAHACACACARVCARTHARARAHARA